MPQRNSKKGSKVVRTAKRRRTNPATGFETLAGKSFKTDHPIKPWKALPDGSPLPSAKRIEQAVGGWLLRVYPSGPDNYNEVHWVVTRIYRNAKPHMIAIWGRDKTYAHEEV